jgi:hypothetical protein
MDLDELLWSDHEEYNPMEDAIEEAEQVQHTLQDPPAHALPLAAVALQHGDGGGRMGQRGHRGGQGGRHARPYVTTRRRARNRVARALERARGDNADWMVPPAHAPLPPRGGGRGGPHLGVHQPRVHPPPRLVVPVHRMGVAGGAPHQPVQDHRVLFRAMHVLAPMLPQGAQGGGPGPRPPPLPPPLRPQQLQTEVSMLEAALTARQQVRQEFGIRLSGQEAMQCFPAAIGTVPLDPEVLVLQARKRMLQLAARKYDDL